MEATKELTASVLRRGCEAAKNVKPPKRARGPVKVTILDTDVIHALGKDLGEKMCGEQTGHCEFIPQQMLDALGPEPKPAPPKPIVRGEAKPHQPKQDPPLEG